MKTANSSQTLIKSYAESTVIGALKDSSKWRKNTEENSFHQKQIRMVIKVMMQKDHNERGLLRFHYKYPFYNRLQRRWLICEKKEWKNSKWS